MHGLSLLTPLVGISQRDEAATKGSGLSHQGFQANLRSTNSEYARSFLSPPGAPLAARRFTQLEWLNNVRLKAPHSVDPVKNSLTF